MDKTDATIQRKLMLQGLMENAGMRELKADLADDMAYANSEVEKMMKVGFISESGLNKLNYCFGLKAGLEMVLNRLAGYEDDLIGDDVKQPKK